MRNEYDQLLELAVKLFVTGVQVETARNKIESLVEMGSPLSSSPVLEANQEFNRLGMLYTDLEGKYIALRDNIKKVNVEGHPLSETK